MKIAFFIVMILGTLSGLGELAYTHYFAGDVLTKGIVYDADNPEAKIAIDVAAEDLPIRLNLGAYGWLEYNSVTPRGQMHFSNGLDQPGDTIRKHFSVSEKDVRARATVGSNSARLNLKDKETYSQSSILFDAASPGTWNISGKPTDENDYVFQTVEATVYVRSKAINWLIAGPGVFFMIAGMIGFIASVKKDQSGEAT